MTGTAICFDLDGTLLHMDRPYGDLLGGVFEDHLGTADPDVIEAYDEAFFAAFEALEPEPYHAGMQAAVGAAGAGEAVAVDEAGGDEAAAVDGGDHDGLLDDLVDALLDAECRATSVDDAARESLAHLAADAALCVVTNGLPDWQTTKLEHHDLADCFDAVVTSYEAGAHKPDPAPFDLARERLPADEYAMVGDDYEADVEGARAAGFVPIHYEDDEDDGPSFWSTVRAMV